MLTKKKNWGDNLISLCLGLLCLVWIYPIVMILLNTFKVESAISTNTAFDLPTADAFAGLDNYVNAVSSKGFIGAFLTSLLITVTSVGGILLFTSMCAWFLLYHANTWIQAVINVLLSEKFKLTTEDLILKTEARASVFCWYFDSIFLCFVIFSDVFRIISPCRYTFWPVSRRVRSIFHLAPSAPRVCRLLQQCPRQ